ncbi:MAG TPA: phosphoribosyl-AMP cyclohydrolase [Candidatus Paceibacterota bacterium]
MITVKDSFILVEDSSLEPNFTKLGDLCLIPAVAQEWTFDCRGRILMVGFQNHEAYDLTFKTGIVHFWSRSRNEIWKKGQTSGNILEVKEIFLDCDQDTLIYMVTASGPVCHTGKTDCFTRRALMYKK